MVWDGLEFWFGLVVFVLSYTCIYPTYLFVVEIEQARIEVYTFMILSVRLKDV
jgi:hypothetical protein